jgi:hypothetical protein
MGQKHVNPKKEKYAKFRKEKPSSMDVRMPDLSEEQQKQKQMNEQIISNFLRFNRPVRKDKDKKGRR